jgi:hypothetical protein
MILSDVFGMEFVTTVETGGEISTGSVLISTGLKKESTTVSATNANVKNKMILNKFLNNIVPSLFFEFNFSTLLSDKFSMSLI